MNIYTINFESKGTIELSGSLIGIFANEKLAKQAAKKYIQEENLDVKKKRSKKDEKDDIRKVLYLENTKENPFAITMIVVPIDLDTIKDKQSTIVQEIQYEEPKQKQKKQKKPKHIAVIENLVKKDIKNDIKIDNMFTQQNDIENDIFTKKFDHGELCGTSLQGNLYARLDQLIRVFGKPEEGNDNKTTVEWCLKFEDGTLAHIYDWKEYETPTDFYDWCIGGESKSAVTRVTQIFKQKLSDENDKCACCN